MGSIIKVLLGHSTPMVQHVLHELITGENDMEVVGEVVDPLGVLRSVREMSIDVVVLSLTETGSLPSMASHLVWEFPNLVIAGISEYQDEAVFHRLWPRTKRIRIATREALISEIRKTVREEWRNESGLSGL